jgi:hypothetical protein
MKIIAALLLVFVLSTTACSTGQVTASSACVAALAALGITIAENTDGTVDLSSVLAILLASGQNIADAVGACGPLFANRTGKDLGLTVIAKTAPEVKKGPAQQGKLPQGKPVRVRIQ